jgi:hypothetical protein
MKGFLLCQRVCADLRILLAEYLVWEPQIHKAHLEWRLRQASVYPFILVRRDTWEEH